MANSEPEDGARGAAPGGPDVPDAPPGARGPEVAPPELELRAVSYAYPSRGGAIPAVADVSLQIGRGEFVAIVGPSGCGKSTLLRLVAGFLVPDTGTVCDEGTAVAGPDWRRGLVFQQPELYPWLTVAENVAFGPRARGLDVATRRSRVAKYLELVGLTEYGTRNVWELSGGMQQRVALARALANEPHILLLDEPFGALDALTREHMQDEMRRIHSRTGRTTLLVTHSVDEAVYLAERCIVLGPRPARIRADIAIDWSAGDAGERGGRRVKASPHFLALRERIMDLIWDEESGVETP